MEFSVEMLRYVFLPAFVLIVITMFMISKRSRRKHKITRENSVPMETELFCFAYRRRIGPSSHHASDGRSLIDERIPNLDRYGHLLLKRGGNVYRSINNRHCYPLVVINIDGEAYLVYGRKNKRLKTEDLGKKVSILFRKYDVGHSFIINDEQSLADEEIWANRSGFFKMFFNYAPSEDPKNSLYAKRLEQRIQEQKEEYKRTTSLPSRIVGRFLEIVLYIAVLGGAIFFLIRFFR